MIAGDLNGHVGQHSWGFHPHHCMVMEHIIRKEWEYNLYAATDLALTNTVFRKRNSVTYYSGKLRKQVTYNSRGSTTQVDYNLVRRTDLKFNKNAKVNKNEECIPQHKLLVAVLKIQIPTENPYFIAGKLKLCRLSQKYKLNTKTWKNLKNLKDCLLTRVGKVCSITKSSWVCHNKTYWWSNAVNDAHKEKQHEWKQWELGENNEEYHFVKRAAACVVYDVKQPVQSEYFRDI